MAPDSDKVDKVEREILRVAAWWRDEPQGPTSRRGWRLGLREGEVIPHGVSLAADGGALYVRWRLLKRHPRVDAPDAPHNEIIVHLIWCPYGRGLWVFWRGRLLWRQRKEGPP